jgi:hypothetical protein
VRTPLDPTDRVEIPQKVKAAVFVRAGGPERVVCEGCGMPLGKKRFHYDHRLAEAFQNTPKSERPPITVADVQLLGEDCCHKPKTRGEVKMLAKGKRQFKGEARIKKARNPMPGSRNHPSGLRKRMSGDVDKW